jgi:hypothetical protein
MQTLNPTTLDRPNLFPLLNTFFEQYQLHECQREVWNLATAFFSQPDDVQLTRAERSSTIFFCAKLDLLFNGLHMVWDLGRQSTVSDDDPNRID